MLNQAHTEDKPIAAHNPQANSIIERSHQTMGNILRTLLHGHEMPNEETANEIVDNALATTVHVMRSAASQSLGSQLPGAMAFNRDMLLNVPLLADLEAGVHQRRQLIIDNNLQRQNARRRHCDYAVGNQVHIKDTQPRKPHPRSHGPHPITRVHAIGTVTLQLTPHIRERINLRRVHPHRT